MTRAIVTFPPRGGVELRDIEFEHAGDVLLKTKYTGICGTDRNIVSGSLAFAKAEVKSEFLVLGHECVAVVQEAPDESPFKRGDYVVPIPTRPGRCPMCQAGRPDFCQDGDFKAAGVTALNGFMRDWFWDEQNYLVKVPTPTMALPSVLTEPLKNVIKVEEQLSHIDSRLPVKYNGGKCVIIGTGPEAMLFAKSFSERGLEVYAVNRHEIESDADEVIRRAGAEFINYEKDKYRIPDGINLIVDTAGDPATLMSFVRKAARNASVVLFGTDGRNRPSPITAEDMIRIVEGNIAILGSVDGAPAHYKEGVKRIERWLSEDPRFVNGIVNRVVRPENLQILRKKEAGEIKSVIEWS